MKRDVHPCFVIEMCLRSFCVTCVELLFISKCVFVPVFPGLAEGEESAQVHGGQRCHALQPSDLHRGQLMDRAALAEHCYFFPMSAAASSSYFLLSAFFCHPLSFHVTMFVVLFLFFPPFKDPTGHKQWT